MDKRQSTIIEFSENVPKTIELSTEPAMAKPKEYTAKVSGKPYTKWTYFTQDGGVFWAFKDLHNDLQRFRKGDSVTLTYIVPMGSKYGNYKVEAADGSGVPARNDMQMLLKENNNLIKMLIQRFDAFLQSQGQAVTSVQPANDEVEEERPSADLGF